VRFGHRERGPAKYTRCVSVAARGVASSLPAPFQLSGASFEVNVIRPLSLSFPRTRVRPFPRPPLCGILYAVPSPICLSPPFSLPRVFFIRLLVVLSFGPLGRGSRISELSSEYIAPKLASARSPRTLALETWRDDVDKRRRDR